MTTYREGRTVCHNKSQRLRRSGFAKACLRLYRRRSRLSTCGSPARIPSELNGRYLRNGPNFMRNIDDNKHHWFLGSGMVHGVRLRDGPGRVVSQSLGSFESCRGGARRKVARGTDPLTTISPPTLIFSLTPVESLRRLRWRPFIMCR